MKQVVSERYEQHKPAKRKNNNIKITIIMIKQNVIFPKMTVYIL